jgi:hypothetical protein
MRRLGLVTAMVVGLVLVVAPAAGALNAKEFRKVANAICRQGTQLRTELLAQHFPDGGSRQPTASEIEAFVGDYRSVVQQQIDSLRALHPPARLKAKMARLLKTARKALAKVVDDPSVLLSGNDPFSSVNRQSLALGLADCAS